LISVFDVVKGPSKGQRFWLPQNNCLEIGREQGVDFRIFGDNRLSRRHLLLETVGIGCRARDLGSSNGTFVNGKRITVAELHSGDTIKIGDSSLRVMFLDDGANPHGQNWLRPKDLRQCNDESEDVSGTTFDHTVGGQSGSPPPEMLDCSTPLVHSVKGSMCLVEFPSTTVTKLDLETFLGERIDSIDWVAVLNHSEASFETLAWMKGCDPQTIERLSRVVYALDLVNAELVYRLLDWEKSRDSLIVFGGAGLHQTCSFKEYAWSLGYPSYLSSILLSERGVELIEQFRGVSILIYQKIDTGNMQVWKRT
jgi:hypothetical protein